MELPFYYTFKDFKDNYEFYYDPNIHTSKLLFLKNYLDKYNSFYNNEKGVLTSERYENLLSEISEKLNQSENLLLDNLLTQTNWVNIDYSLNTEPNNFYHCLYSEIGTPEKYKNLIEEYVSEWSKNMFIHNIKCGKLNKIQKIIDYIQEEIEREKINILRFQNSPPQQVQTDEPEPLTTNQTKKIGLLIRSGIIDFLREKNPKISDNQIAGFIQLLSKEPLKQNSINPHLSKTNSKYAIKNKQDKNDLDLILKQFGISPQSE